MNLTGARVVITGGSRGIGEGLALGCAVRGARVALVARSHDRIEKLAYDFGGDAYPADLGDPSAIEPLVRRIEEDGPIDVLVNNAGVDLAGALTETAPADIERVFAINLVAPVLMCRAVLPGMLERGRGHVMNVSSLAGTNVIPGLVPYASSKAGLSHFTAGLRVELKGTGITTTLAEIGPVESAMMGSARSHDRTRLAFERFEKLRLSYDMKMSTVVDAMIAAIERDRRHLRMPARDALFPMLVEAPRRMTEWLLVGVK